MPPGCSGWQRQTRFVPNHTPLAVPCFCTASYMYMEQVGWKRQCWPSNGLMKRL